MTALVDGMVLVMGRQLSTELPGGEFGALVQRWRRQRSPFLQTNSSGERNFALVDAILHKAPNVDLAKAERKVMFKANQTRLWYERKTKEERPLWTRTIQPLLRHDLSTMASQLKITPATRSLWEMEVWPVIRLFHTCFWCYEKDNKTCWCYHYSTIVNCTLIYVFV